jgi:hypothetical protein
MQDGTCSVCWAFNAILAGARIKEKLKTARKCAVRLGDRSGLTLDDLRQWFSDDGWYVKIRCQEMPGFLLGRTNSLVSRSLLKLITNLISNFIKKRNFYTMEPGLKQCLKVQFTNIDKEKCDHKNTVPYWPLSYPKSIVRCEEKLRLHLNWSLYEYRTVRASRGAFYRSFCATVGSFLDLVVAHWWRSTIFLMITL